MDKPDQPTKPPRAVRLNFSFDGDRVELLSRWELEKRVPPQPPSGESPAPPEFAVELRAADGRVLHRVALHDPLSRHVEVFDGSSISRTEVERPSGAFTVVVPALEEGDRVALVSRRPPGRDRAMAPLRQPALVIEVPLRDQRADPA